MLRELDLDTDKFQLVLSKVTHTIKGSQYLIIKIGQRLDYTEFYKRPNMIAHSCQSFFGAPLET